MATHWSKRVFLPGFGLVLALCAAGCRRNTPVASTVGEQPVSWVVVQQYDRELEHEAPLIQGGLQAVLELLRPGDRFLAVAFAAEPRLLVRREVKAPETDGHEILQQLTEAEVEPGQARPRAALELALEQAEPSGDTAGQQPTVLALISDGRSGAPGVAQGAAHEEELRALAAIADRWRQRPSTRVVLVGVITDPTSHWSLQNLQRQLGAELVLVRSRDAVTVRAALATLGRTVQAARRESATRQTRREGGTGPLTAAIGAGLFIGLAAASRLRRRVRRESRRIRHRDVRMAETEPLTDLMAEVVRIKVMRPGTGGDALQMVRERTFRRPDLSANRGRIRVGTALDSDVQLPALPEIRPLHVTFDLGSPDQVAVEVAPEAEVGLLGEQVRGPDLRPIALSIVELEVGPFTVSLAREMEG